MSKDRSETDRPGQLRKAKDEFVLGVVAPIGADITTFESILSGCLSEYGYAPNVIKLSDLLKAPELKKVGIEIDYSSSCNRYHSLMSAGNAIREITKQNDFLAKYAITRIAQSRSADEKTGEPRPLRGTVHTLHSLKHTEEVKTLREVYGLGFWLVGLYCYQAQRQMRLCMGGAKIEEAVGLIQRDQDEKNITGQQARKVFELSDVFIHLDLNNLEKTRKQLERFLDLVFGHPFRTPTRDENAMFLAYSASLRSGSLARQIGAVVASSTGEVIATGTNDVPCAGGGQYWPGDYDLRDHARGFDYNTYQRDQIIKSLARKVIEDQQKKNENPEEAGKEKTYTDDDYLKEGKRLFRGSPIFDLTEYGRDVHAEMEALLSCARIGVSPRGGTLYSTTFPCHNCAKHIVAAGIKRVVYVEPYPKSKARELLSDSITIELETRREDKVSFEHFVGVGPRRYFDLFSMALGMGRPIERKHDDGKKVEWLRTNAVPRIPMRPLSYQDREKLSSQNFKKFEEEVAGHDR
jgi:deoxycytidylate deaminase